MELKGRVACEMGMNELMITELVLRNILTRLKPPEVAALLSALIFQAKTENSENFNSLPKDLQKVIQIHIFTSLDIKYIYFFRV